MDFHFLYEISQSLTVFVLVAACALYCLFIVFKLHTTGAMAPTPDQINRNR